MRLFSEERLILRRAERAVDRMSEMERCVFLAIRVDEMGYPDIAGKLGIDVDEVEQHFAASLETLLKVMDEKDPWWWKFWPW